MLTKEKSKIYTLEKSKMIPYRRSEMQEGMLNKEIGRYAGRSKSRPYNTVLMSNL